VAGRSPIDAEPSSARVALPARLDALLGERWPFFGGRIAATAGAYEALPLPAPGDAEGGAALAARFERYCQAQPGGDLRGLGSLWVQWYAVSVWPPLIAAALLWREGPCLDGAPALLLDASACPVGLQIAPEAARGEPTELLEKLARHQAGPLCAAVARGTRMAPRVPWSNVANVFSWMLGELGAIADGATLAPGYALLASPRFSDGAANPLFLGTGANAATGRPERRVCCLRYRLDGFGYCSDCPVTLRHGAAAT
jgi:ferric iron reductase protein FhuF